MCRQQLRTHSTSRIFISVQYVIFEHLGMATLPFQTRRNIWYMLLYFMIQKFHRLLGNFFVKWFFTCKIPNVLFILTAGKCIARFYNNFIFYGIPAYNSYRLLRHLVQQQFTFHRPNVNFLLSRHGSGKVIYIYKCNVICMKRHHLIYWNTKMLICMASKCI